MLLPHRFLAGALAADAIGVTPALGGQEFPTGLLPDFRQTEGNHHVASAATGVSGLAGRYATALFDLADQERAFDAIADDLRRLAAMIESSADLQRLIRSPVLTREAQASAMAALLARAGVSPLTANFVGLVARNRRLFALPGMITFYLQLLAERRGEIPAVVTAAQRLSDAQVAAINDQLRREVGAKVAVEIMIDPAIIGGLVVKIGSRLIDFSVRGKLQRLQLAMRGL
jgi:F-type H+-transporting ATPase subunit delta